jgi:peptide/nickel transport system permease protein
MHSRQGSFGKGQKIAALSSTELTDQHPGLKKLYTFWSLFMSRRNAMIGTIVFAIIAGAGLLAPYIAPYGPNEMNIPAQLLSPSADYPFGTDNFGRDLFSRILYATRVSLFVGFSVVIVSGLFGTFIGLMSGYFPRLDNILMRIMDALMAFPAILLGMAIMGALGASLINVIIALIVVYTPRIARVVRGSVLTLSKSLFVENAVCVGCSDSRIVFAHILPNCLAPLIIQLTFTFAYAILAEAALTFLGIGAPPEVPSWGVIINEGRPLLSRAPWLVTIPGISIMITVLSLNLIGDGLRDTLDPRLKNVLS